MVAITARKSDLNDDNKVIQWYLKNITQPKNWWIMKQKVDKKEAIVLKLAQF